MPCRACRPHLLALLLALLVGCGAAPAPSYPQVQRTAAAAGCWPDQPPFPTPPPVTVTVAGLAPPPAPPGGPTATPRATTTPLPRCPPAPGSTARPWPTPVPPPPPYPTMDPRRWVGGSGLQTTLNLPTWILDMDIAVHPTEGWPVAGAAVWSGDDRPEYAMVTVYNPLAGRWMPAHQVDLGPAALGRYSRSIRVGVAGRQTVVAIWGMSDGNLRTGDPPSRVWAASSEDYGATWSAPEPIGDGCRQVNDLDTTTDGHVVAQLICSDGPHSFPAIVARSPDGRWSAPARLPIAAWRFSPGTVTILPTEPPRVVSTLFSGVDGGMRTPLVYALGADLVAAADPGAWTIARRVVAAGDLPLGPRMWHARAALLDRPAPHLPGVAVAWADAAGGHALAMSSLDGGQSWGPIRAVRRGDAGPIDFVSLAYDPSADRLAAIWTCCRDQAGPTHYGSWSPPDGGWRPNNGEQPIPLVLGARAAADSDLARARGSRVAWLAWVEHQSQLHIRSVDLDAVIPVVGEE